jgi:hypothetical protein
MRYTIVKHDSLEILVDHVNALIADDWALQGGVAAIAVPAPGRWRRQGDS